MLEKNNPKITLNILYTKEKAYISCPAYISKLIRAAKNNFINDSKGLYIYDIQEKCPIF